MKNRPKRLTRSVVVRLNPSLYDELRNAAEINECTVSEQIRWILRHHMGLEDDAC